MSYWAGKEYYYFQKLAEQTESPEIKVGPELKVYESRANSRGITTLLRPSQSHQEKSCAWPGTGGYFS